MNTCQYSKAKKLLCIIPQVVPCSTLSAQKYRLYPLSNNGIDFACVLANRMVFDKVFTVLGLGCA
jgi:hypothetical protein